MYLQLWSLRYSLSRISQRGFSLVQKYLPTILCHDDDACGLGDEASANRYFALLAKLIATEDLSVLSRLVEFAVVVTGTTIFHGAVVLPALLWIFGKMNPITFFKGARTALVTAFATSSSSATMPLSMKCAQENLGVRPQTAGFVIPLGKHN